MSERLSDDRIRELHVHFSFLSSLYSRDVCTALAELIELRAQAKAAAAGAKATVSGNTMDLHWKDEVPHDNSAI